MKPAAVVAAAIAAVVGAGTWAAISYYTGYEIGWIAWGIGAVIGYAAVATGGNGPIMATVCALIATGSLLIGKVTALQWMIQESATQSYQGQENYDFVMADVDTFAVDSTVASYPYLHTFYWMIESDDTTVYTPEEQARFEAVWPKRLTRYAADKPSLEQWNETETQELAGDLVGLMTNQDYIAAMRETLHPLDILFFGLGIVTAFQIVNAAGKEGVTIASGDGEGNAT